MSDNQRTRVLEVMADERWRTLFEIEAELRRRGFVYMTTSISARIREIRQQGFSVERQRREGKSAQVIEYRITVPRPVVEGEQIGLFA